MFLRSLRQIRRTIGFRLALMYSSIIVLSTLLLFAFTYFLLSSSLRKQHENTIELRLGELSALYQTGGMDSLKKEILVEKKFEKKTPFFIRLASSQNQTMLLILPYQWVDFNLKQLERGKPPENEKWIRMPLKDDKYQLEIKCLFLTGGYLLQVGKSNEDFKKTLTHFRGIFAIAIIPLIIFSFVGGAFASFRALRPIRNLINTIRTVDVGKMDARVLSPGTGDELDELIMLFNEMLTRIEFLINRMRGTLDNVAHDLRTPMTRLRGIAELALGSERDIDTFRDALADCLEESERILMILNTLMDISEAETGVMRLDLGFVDIGAMIGEVVDIYGYLAEEKGLHLAIDVPNGLHGNLDSARMSQALANLLDNAIKYTPHGGQIRLKAYQQQKHLVISIKDTGLGIPQEEIPRIWDRLYRGDQSRHQRGLGLGLSLVKAIISAHKGQVDVFSEPGKGSTFMIYLPAIG